MVVTLHSFGACVQVRTLEDSLDEARAENVELSRVWPHLDSITQQLEETRAALQEVEQSNAELQGANSKLTLAAKHAAEEHEISLVRKLSLSLRASHMDPACDGIDMHLQGGHCQ